MLARLTDLVFVTAAGLSYNKPSDVKSGILLGQYRKTRHTMEVYKRVLVFCTIIFPIHVSVQGESHGFLFEHDDVIYKITLEEEDPRTWMEAEEICDQEEGGHLASVTSDEENTYLNDKIRLISQSRNVEKLWIGAIDEELFGQYAWVDGKPFRYAAAQLAGGEQYQRRHEMCLMLKSNPDVGSFWEEEDCYSQKGYICKIEGQPKSLTERRRFGYEFDYGKTIYKYFLLQYEMLTWPEAEYYCRNMEYGHLPSIESLKENKQVMKTLRRLRWMYGFSKLWVGASDLYDEGKFHWSDNSTFDFQNWAPGHPGRVNGRGEKRDCMALSHPNLGRWEDERCLQHLPFMCKRKVCAQRADIAFAVDASSSVTRNGFFKAKDFVKSVIAGVNTGSRRVRISLIRFANDATLIFPFNRYYWWGSLFRAIDAMEYRLGGTRTDKALNMARTQVFTQGGGARDNVPRLLVLLTDGRSTFPPLTKKEAIRLKENGVYVLVLAIGKKVNNEELTNIASRPNDVISASSYSDLKKIVEQTRIRLCRVNDPHEGITLRKH